MKKVGIIGGGISGLSLAQNLKDKFKVKVFEKDARPGGLIKCSVVNGNLYHIVGGHVFNSKRKDVLDWFWSYFNKEEEFSKSKRNAVVDMETMINYPIENHLYQFTDKSILKAIIEDLFIILKSGYGTPQNFEEFLKGRFGQTLYNNYFKPYNEKIWKTDLAKVSLEWLEGKLPMPTVNEIIFNNLNKEEESKMVHSSFYYPKNNGSQFLADRLAEGIDISYDKEVYTLNNESQNKWIVNEDEEFDIIVFAGNIKCLPKILQQNYLRKFEDEIQKLSYHGTTTVLCEVEPNDYSWVYLPSKKHRAHRIICTGNFSSNNNQFGKNTATIEFTDFMSKQDILKNLNHIPLNPRYLDHRYTEFTYPIQDNNTRTLINKIKKNIEINKIYLLGRFAEWEYYNMDAAVGAALDLQKII